MCLRQQPAVPPRNPVGRKKGRCPAHSCRDPLPRSGQHSQRHVVCDSLPILPKVKLRQIIGPHQPNEPLRGIEPFQRMQCLRSIACAKARFDVCDLHTRMRHHRPRVVQTRHHRRRSTGFQRITGAYQPPNLIQTKSFEGFTRDMRVACVGRVKRSTQQSDHLTGGGIWNIIAQNVDRPPKLLRGRKEGRNARLSIKLNV